MGPASLEQEPHDCVRNLCRAQGMSEACSSLYKQILPGGSWGPEADP